MQTTLTLQDKAAHITRQRNDPIAITLDIGPSCSIRPIDTMYDTTN